MFTLAVRDGRSLLVGAVLNLGWLALICAAVFLRPAWQFMTISYVLLTISTYGIIRKWISAHEEIDFTNEFSSEFYLPRTPEMKWLAAWYNRTGVSIWILSSVVFLFDRDAIVADGGVLTVVIGMLVVQWPMFDFICQRSYLALGGDE